MTRSLLSEVKVRATYINFISLVALRMECVALTFAPRLASSRATAAPMPREAPVTMAILPARVSGWLEFAEVIVGCASEIIGGRGWERRVEVSFVLAYPAICAYSQRVLFNGECA